MFLKTSGRPARPVVCYQLIDSVSLSRRTRRQGVRGASGSGSSTLGKLANNFSRAVTCVDRFEQEVKMPTKILSFPYSLLLIDNLSIIIFL